MSVLPRLRSQSAWFKDLKSEERGLYLIHLLVACGNHVASGKLDQAEITLREISALASPHGDTMQRIAAYFTEALAVRIVKSWPGVHDALNGTRISSVMDEIVAHNLFFDMFPFLKIACVLANQAILDAMEGEKMVHVIDLNVVEPRQWLALVQSFSARPGGPPHLKITGINEKKEVLDYVGSKLAEEADKLKIPFRFNPIIGRLDDLDPAKLCIKTGEALAISCNLHLHSLLASSSNGIHSRKLAQMEQPKLREFLAHGGNGCNRSTVSNSSATIFLTPLKMDHFLKTMRGLSPKLMVLMEQDCNHNGLTLMERLLEALYSYGALFDCLESTASRTSMDRLKVEKLVFGEEIKNIIACEGDERKERHERLEKWIQWLDFAGFEAVPLSYDGVMQARRLLAQGHGSHGYKIKEKNGCEVICWYDQPLFSVSAWRRRG